MENKTDSNRGEIIDIILINDIHQAPEQSLTDQLYRIGDSEAFITIQCDKRGHPISAACIKHIKISQIKTETKYVRFDNSEDALFISNACKQRLAGQVREQAKIDNFNKRFR